MGLDKQKAMETGFHKYAREYQAKLTKGLGSSQLECVFELSKLLENAWKMEKRVYICGNGGSGANAIHIANDFHYGVGCTDSGCEARGIRVEALTANSAILSCLANDIGYGEIFAHQLGVKADKGDILIVLSGSGESQNVVKAIERAKELEMKAVARVAYSGGSCKQLADLCIHLNTRDMQVAEDLQLVVGHMCMQWLNRSKKEIA